jgi:hypothetical protein
MAGMFDLANIFQFVVDSFDDGTFAKHDFAGIRHDRVFIFFFKLLISCIPLIKSISKSSFPIYPLSAKNFSDIFF